MVSDLKSYLVMTTQRRPNVQLKSTPAVVSNHERIQTRIASDTYKFATGVYHVRGALENRTVEL